MPMDMNPFAMGAGQVAGAAPNMLPKMPQQVGGLGNGVVPDWAQNQPNPSMAGGINNMLRALSRGAMAGGGMGAPGGAPVLPPGGGQLSAEPNPVMDALFSQPPPQMGPR